MKLHLVQTGLIGRRHGRRHEIMSGMAGQDPVVYQRDLEESRRLHPTRGKRSPRTEDIPRFWVNHADGTWV